MYRYGQHCKVECGLAVIGNHHFLAPVVLLWLNGVTFGAYLSALFVLRLTCTVILITLFGGVGVDGYLAQMLVWLPCQECIISDCNPSLVW